MPVPAVRKTMCLLPFPAPNRHSASAEALASFIRKARPPKMPVKARQISIFTQPGRFGGDRITPRAASSGPPQEIPNTTPGPGSSPSTVFRKRAKVAA
jgi:hypothetical protein